jgi:UTP--glucose-1-phosphate uridylyltransferase
MTRPRVSKALIPAAGRGTRFLPVTKTVPKELLPIVSTPALELVVAEVAANGIADVALVISPGKQGVVDYFAADPDLEQAVARKPQQLASITRAATLARIHQAEQLVPRGLGDAVAQGEQFAAGEPIAVLLPDDLIDDRDQLLGPMLDTYAELGGVVLALLDVPRVDISMYGSIQPAPGADLSADVIPIADLVEKPPADEAPSTLAVIGRYVLPPQIFDALRATEPGALGEIQLTDGIRRLAHDGVPVHGVVFRGRRYDTGNPLNYLQTVVQLAGRHPEVGAAFGTWLREYVQASDANDGRARGESGS